MDYILLLVSLATAAVCYGILSALEYWYNHMFNRYPNTEMVPEQGNIAHHPVYDDDWYWEFDDFNYHGWDLFGITAGYHGSESGDAWRVQENIKFKSSNSVWLGFP